MADACAATGQNAEAESCYKRAMSIYEKHGEAESPRMAKLLDNCVALLKKAGRPAEARTLEARMRAIRAKS
jgi:hypothetical protein